jgi:hypothetical protein
VPTLSPAVYQWATRHRVSLQALQELQALFGMHGGHDLPATVKGTSEAAVQAAVRLEAARKGVRLFRNNVGALIDSRGVPVRYGLANESKQVNEVMKSADLIGWRPVLIGPQHVGQVIGQFVSREVTAVGWHYTGNDREPAQLAWAQLVTAGGGDAAFCTGEGTL